jgi:hypothetical protein
MAEREITVNVYFVTMNDLAKRTPKSTVQLYFSIEEICLWFLDTRKDRWIYQIHIPPDQIIPERFYTLNHPYNLVGFLPAGYKKNLQETLDTIQYITTPQPKSINKLDLD